MVRAYDESGTQVGQAQASIDDGKFELSEIPSGRYRLAFTDIGCGYKRATTSQAPLLLNPQALRCFGARSSTWEILSSRRAVVARRMVLTGNRLPQ